MNYVIESEVLLIDENNPDLKYVSIVGANLTEKKIWDSGARIDVYRVTAGDKIIIYELKVGTGEPIHLYQLKMYWDGLVIEGQQPDEAVLLVENYDSKLEEMANKMNTFQPIIEKGKPYNFKVMKFSEVGLMKSTIER